MGPPLWLDPTNHAARIMLDSMLPLSPESCCAEGMRTLCMMLLCLTLCCSVLWQEGHGGADSNPKAAREDRCLFFKEHLPGATCPMCNLEAKSFEGLCRHLAASHSMYYYSTPVLPASVLARAAAAAGRAERQVVGASSNAGTPVIEVSGQGTRQAVYA